MIKFDFEEHDPGIIMLMKRIASKNKVTRQVITHKKFKTSLIHTNFKDLQDRPNQSFDLSNKTEIKDKDSSMHLLDKNPTKNHQDELVSLEERRKIFKSSYTPHQAEKRDFKFEFEEIIRNNKNSNDKKSKKIFSNMVEYVNHQVGSPKTQDIKNNKINIDLTKKQNFHDENKFNRLGNAIANSSEKIKRQIRNKNEGSSGSKSSKKENKSVDIGNWKDFLNEQIVNKNKAEYHRASIVDDGSADYLLMTRKRNRAKYAEFIISNAKSSINSSTTDMYLKTNNYNDVFNVSDNVDFFGEDF